MEENKPTDEERRKYSEEDHRMDRLNQIKGEINRYNLNPLKLYTDEETGDQLYGYELIFQNLNSFFAEIDFELTKEEKLKAIIKMNKIERILITKETKPHQVTQDINHNKTIFFDKELWFILKKLLFNYQTFLYGLEKKHSPKNKPKEFSYK